MNTRTLILVLVVGLVIFNGVYANILGRLTSRIPKGTGSVLRPRPTPPVLKPSINEAVISSRPTQSIWTSQSSSSSPVSTSTGGRNWLTNLFSRRPVSSQTSVLFPKVDKIDWKNLFSRPTSISETISRLNGENPNPAVDHISVQNKTQLAAAALLASIYTRTTAKTFALDMNVKDHTVDFNTEIPNPDHDVQMIDYINNADEETLSSIHGLIEHKDDVVKYFTVDFKIADRIMHLRIGNFSKNITVEGLMLKPQKLAKRIYECLDNPLVSFTMSQTPYAKVFNNLKIALKIVSNPQQAYAIFTNKYPISVAFADLSFAVYKDPKNYKKHILDAIPRIGDAMLEKYKKKLNLKHDIRE